MSHELLRITVEGIEDARLMRVAGEVDASTAAELRRHLEGVRADRATLLLDLADVAFMDSTGLRVLLDASAAAATSGWPFFIVRASAAVQRLIALTSTGAELAVVATDDRLLA
jgi:anti-anti-sigma factor